MGRRNELLGLAITRIFPIPLHRFFLLKKLKKLGSVLCLCKILYIKMMGEKKHGNKKTLCKL
jgi:hypothetical protein